MLEQRRFAVQVHLTDKRVQSADILAVATELRWLNLHLLLLNCCSCSPLAYCAWCVYFAMGCLLAQMAVSIRCIGLSLWTHSGAVSYSSC